MFGKFRNLDLFIESMKYLREFDGLYDEIYPMHSSFPVKPELIRPLLEGAQQIKSGEASYTQISRFGIDIALYRFPYAGYLCDLPQ